MLFLFLRFFRRKKITAFVLAVLLTFSSLVYNVKSVQAGALSSAYNRTNDSRPSISAVQYITGWTFPGTTSIKCMNIQFTTTASGVTEPTGMVTTDATKSSVSGGGLTDGNWTLWNAVDGTLQYEYSAGGATTATAVTATTNNITNPSSAGVIYAQIKTYSVLSTHTCSTLVDNVTISFDIITGQALSVNVDPSLTFAINGVAASQTVNGSTTTGTTTGGANTIPLSNVNPTTNAIAAHDLVISTNALSGYTVYASYSATLSDGASHTIADHTGTNTSPATFPATGTSAFGYTTESTTLSGTGGRFSGGKWAKFEAWNYEVARKATKASSDTTRIGYQAGVSSTQEAGTYTTTITLTATPTY